MAPTPHSLPALRRLLADRYPDAQLEAQRGAARLAAPVATGIAALDAALPRGGLPRGQLTAWTPAGGAAAVLRTACRAAQARGERAAWIDATGVVSLEWAATADEPDGPERDAGPLVVRPGSRVGALRAAALLLRSGAFSLIVLEPAPGEEPIGTETVRLGRAAREGDAAGVVLTERTSAAALRVTSRLDTRGLRWRRDAGGNPAEPVSVRVDVRARASGWNAHVVLSLPITPFALLEAIAPGPDRRGTARARGLGGPRRR